LLWLGVRVFVNYLSRLAANGDSPDLSLPSTYNCRRKPLVPG
jgi:hypothetical protein